RISGSVPGPCVKASFGLGTNLKNCPIRKKYDPYQCFSKNKNGILVSDALRNPKLTVKNWRKNVTQLVRATLFLSWFLFAFGFLFCCHEV
ncbi:MAG: hypothetical protein MN733_23665, partial [Nitrososphaera sp.]|nr:hypothetical protein [Nitrososphaera sp.]